VPIPVAMQSKKWVCGHSLAEIVGLNPVGDMDVFCELCIVKERSLCWADHLPSRFLQSLVFPMSVIAKPCKGRL